MELKDRERKIDISKMSPAQAEALGVQIGDKMRQICDDAAQKANAILNIYGASCKIAIAFDEIPAFLQPTKPAPKKRGRKPKAANLKV